MFKEEFHEKVKHFKPLTKILEANQRRTYWLTKPEVIVEELYLLKQKRSLLLNDKAEQDEYAFALFSILDGRVSDEKINPTLFKKILAVLPGRFQRSWIQLCMQNNFCIRENKKKLLMLAGALGWHTEKEALELLL